MSNSFIDWYLADADAALRGYVVDFVCQDCRRRLTIGADWEERPVCCGWEMVDLIGTVRREGIA